MKEVIIKYEAQIKLLTEQNALKDIIINGLTLRLTELENQISKNSRNSSKPPSTDSFERTKSLRVPSGKKRGGQKGHTGHHLKMEDKVNDVVVHKVCKCRFCDNDLSASASLDHKIRQVIEIPPVLKHVIEHRAESKHCPHCQKVTEASFPEGISQAVQYGNNIKTWAIYLLNFQLIPIGRVAQFFKDFCGIRISEGTLVNFQMQCHQNLQGFEQDITVALQKQPVVHFDETGFYFEDSRQWLHVACTKALTLYMPHAKRGKEAMDAMNILPGFKGVAVHDFWGSYMDYDCEHELCNAHHLRDFAFCKEAEKSTWAAQMADLLLAIKSKVDDAKNQNQLCLEIEQTTQFQQQYDQLVETGKQQNPLPERQAGKRGRIKKSKTQNMIERFDEQRKSVIGFMYDFNVPFDNNLAEIAIRMTKTKQKVSGCFRSFDGAKAFARIRSYISTMRKQGQNLIEALLSVAKGNPILPDFHYCPIVLSG